MATVLYNYISNAIKYYKKMTPSYFQIQDLYSLSENSLSKNSLSKNSLSVDHLAIRSIQSEGGIQVIKNVLLKNEIYKSGGTLEIPEKHLQAEWFYTDKSEFRKLAPRIFVSEIEESKLSVQARHIIKKRLTSNILSCYDYDSANQESEYLSWYLLHGRVVNHLALTTPRDMKIQEFVAYLKILNFNINNIGGEIKTSRDGMLHQSSIMSDHVNYVFKEEMRRVPGFFVEFIQRDKCGNNIREGFESQNALHIFDSTSNHD